MDPDPDPSEVRRRGVQRLLQGAGRDLLASGESTSVRTAAFMGFFFTTLPGVRPFGFGFGFTGVGPSWGVLELRLMLSSSSSCPRFFPWGGDIRCCCLICCCWSCCWLMRLGSERGVTWHVEMTKRVS